MPWSASTRIETQPELSTRQQQHSHHVVLQAFAYKTATPREATNTLEYLKNLQYFSMFQSLPWETDRCQTNITSTQKWKSAASNQQSYGTCLTSMTLLLLAPRPISRRPPKRPIAAPALPPAGGVVGRVTFALLLPTPHEIEFLPRGRTTSPPAAAWRRLPPARLKAGGPPTWSFPARARRPSRPPSSLREG